MKRIVFCLLLLLCCSFSRLASAADLIVEVKSSAGVAFPGAPVKIHDSRAGTDISLLTDSSGTARLTNVAAGRFVITPMVSRVTFAPTSAVVDIVSSDVKRTFLGDIGTGAASGKIVDGLGNSIQNAAVYTGSTGWAPTNGVGGYAIGKLKVGATTLIPLHKCSGFAPAQGVANIVSEGQIASGTHFTRSSEGTSTIWGQITRNGQPLNGVSVALSEGGVVKFNGTTDENGFYAIQNVPVGSYTITPSKQNHLFAPQSKTLDISTCDIYGQQSFISGSTEDRYTVSGRVMFNGAPLAGVTIVGGTSSNGSAGYTPDHGSVITAEDGSFQFNDYAFYESAYVFLLQSGYRSNPARLEKVITGNTSVEFIARLTQCNDGIDNDSDGVEDYPGDYGCLSIDSDREDLRIPDCQDGVDTDGDGLVDLQDPGCSTAQDNSERDPFGPACDNGVDDDNDALGDFPRDPGCDSVTDTLETSAFKACDDGIDNDQDGLIDLADTGCSDANDQSEKTAAYACDDGIDNDKDGLVDLNDPGCSSTLDAGESSVQGAQCDDGVDNDGDGAIDGADKGCVDAFDTDESNDNQCTKYFAATFQNTLSEGTGRMKAIGYEMAKRHDFAARKKEYKKHMKQIQKLYSNNISLVYSLPSVNHICAESCTEVSNSAMIQNFRTNVESMYRYIDKLTLRYYKLKGYNTRSSKVVRSLKFVKKLKAERDSLLRLSTVIPESMKVCSPKL